MGQRSLARWWAVSPVDGAVHLLVREGDHSPGVVQARCGALCPRMPTSTTSRHKAHRARAAA
jgi:hypothetical protein